MKKLWFVFFAMSLTGCGGCATHHASEKQLRVALADTNADLTQCRDQLSLTQQQAERLGLEMEKYKKHARNR